MKLPYMLFAVFALMAAVGVFVIYASRSLEGEGVGAGFLVLGCLGAVVLPFLVVLGRRT